MKANKIFLIKFLLSLVVFLGYTLPSYILAQDYNTVVINELMWTGSESSSSDEWIELKNMTDQEIDLSGYKIKYANDNEMVSISSGKIPANGYFLIANSTQSHQYSGGESILDIAPDYIDDGVSLSNSSLKIQLVDSTDAILDIAGDGGKPLAGNNDKKYSMERNDIVSDGTLSSSWHTATSAVNIDLTSSAKATPKSANSPSLFQPITSYPTDLDKYITIDDCLEAQGTVNYIIDGDTLDIDLNGEKVRVRFIGIDAPESSKSSDFGVDEPYCTESKDYILNLLLNKDVTIIVSSDPNEQYDSYNRLLAVILLDDQNINLSSVQEGLSRTYYLDNPIVKKDSWIGQENIAQQNHLGMWKYFNLDLGVYINEIMPNPEGDDAQGEWIELYNSQDQSVDLSNWFLDDSEHGSNPYLIPQNTVIKPHGYLVVSILDSQIALNNSGDNIRLFTPDLNILNEISYSQNAKENISYMRETDNIFRWTKTPTPGSKNIYSDPDRPDYEKVDKINQLNDKKAGDFVEFEGYVNSEPHQLSDQYFYVEDATAGVQIYNYDKNFPTINIGQKVRILGEISDSKILRVKINDPKDIVLLDQTMILIPDKFSPNEINKSYVGKLIKVEGEVSKLSGQTFYIKDQNSELKIQIRGPTDFKRPDISRGDVILITGVLYQSSQGNITLLPRFLRDIIIIKKADASSSQENPAVVNQLSDLKNLSGGDYVLVKGVVNCLPSMLGKQYFYIEDNTGGVQVYSYGKIFPDLMIGDYIEVYGQLSESKTRIKTNALDNFQIIDSGKEITPIAIDKNTNLSSYYGMLVSIQGTVIYKKNQKITILVDGRKFIIYLKDATNIKSSLLKIGDFVSIIGIIDNYQDEYRINPRFLSDIDYSRKITTKKSLDESSTHVKSFSKRNYLPKLHKYLVKAPKNQYNLMTFKNIIKTILFIFQIILFSLIMEWLCNKQLQQKIY